MHSQGIVHMDLKWDNVLWDPITQSVVVADFDLACFVDDCFLPKQGTAGTSTTHFHPGSHLHSLIRCCEKRSQ